MYVSFIYLQLNFNSNVINAHETNTALCLQLPCIIPKLKISQFSKDEKCQSKFSVACKTLRCLVWIIIVEMPWYGLAHKII